MKQGHLLQTLIKRKCRSSITIYLTLMLVLVMALICTLIESGRVSAMNARLRSITYMAADSCFAEFAEPLFSDYGVMFLWCDEAEFTEKFNAYVTHNLSLDGTEARNDITLYGMQHVQTECSDITWATDQNGEVFARQVESYMKYHLAEEAVEKLLEHTSFFEQSEHIQHFMDRIQDYKKIFIKVEDHVSNIQKKIEKAKDLAADPKGLFNELEKLLDQYDENADVQADFSRRVNDLRKTGKEISECLTDINKETKKYYESVAEAKVKVDEIEEELEEKKESYDKEVYNVIKEEVDDIKTKSADTNADYYHVIENETTVNAYLSKLEGLDQFCAFAQTPLSEDNLSEYKKQTAFYRDQFSDFDLGALSVALNMEQTAQEDDGFIDAIHEIFSSGFLGFLAGEVSEKETDQTSFPSITVGKVAAEDTEEEKESLLNLAANKALFTEYILEHLGNYRETKENSVLDYEAEYVLGGKKADKDNLSSVIGKIVLIRSGLNLISLLQDGEKRTETYALASGIIGFTGQPVLIKIVQLLIISAWSAAESLTDVKALLEGKKVPILKKADDWNLSLEGIKNFSEEMITGKDCKHGLTYEDYLRVLLLMQNRKKQYFRTMDILQANMCANENEYFRFKDSIAAVTVRTEYVASILFPTLPPAGRILRVHKGRYLFHYEQEYQY